MGDRAFGDFQTPSALAEQVCRKLAGRGVENSRFQTVVEPTCGLGGFLEVASTHWPSAEILGFEINEDYVHEARARVPRAHVERADFFVTDWAERSRDWAEPILVVGNPPWVTNAELSSLESSNTPRRSNSRQLRGLDAQTGKSNFDISEWMLIRLLEVLQNRSATVAVLIKTTTARRVLEYAHARGLSLSSAAMLAIDAQQHFEASVDACLFMFETRETSESCQIYESLDDARPVRSIGFREGILVADAEAYDASSAWLGRADPPWRSGLKHDCARVMELRRNESGDLVNGFAEPVSVEDTLVFPLLKSSDLKREEANGVRRWVLVPQTRIGEDTARLEREAPLAWQYLTLHATRLAARKSRIYANQPDFAIFGIGDYSFAPWKVCISGLYKTSHFTLVGPVEGKPVMLDDTCYFVGFEDEADARHAWSALNSERAQTAIRALAFWDAKRPITKELLTHLEIDRLR